MTSPPHTIIVVDPRRERWGDTSAASFEFARQHHSKSLREALVSAQPGSEVWVQSRDVKPDELLRAPPACMVRVFHPERPSALLPLTTNEIRGSELLNRS